MYSEELSNTERLKSEIEDLEQSIKVKVELIGKFQQEDLEKFKEKHFLVKNVILPLNQKLALKNISKEFSTTLMSVTIVSMKKKMIMLMRNLKRSVTSA